MRCRVKKLFHHSIGILRHAHLKDEWFKHSIIEIWRGNDALIPYDWPEMRTS